MAATDVVEDPTKVVTPPPPAKAADPKIVTAPSIPDSTANLNQTYKPAGDNPYALTGEDNPFGRYSKALEALTASSQMTAATGSFDEAKGTAGRVNEITSKNSPLMQLAQTQAKQQMASKGLSNSSMAIGAGQKAVIETATPIAAQDASLYSQQQIENQRSLNAAASQNAQMNKEIGLKGLELSELGRQFDVKTINDLYTFEKEYGLKTQIFNEDTRQFDAELGLKTSIFNEDTRQYEQDFGLKKDVFKEDVRQYDETMGEKKREFDVGEAGTNARFDKELAFKDKTLGENIRQFDTSETNKMTMAERDNAVRLELQRMGDEAAMDRGKTGEDAAYRTNMMARISAIQQNPDLDGPTKTTLVENELNGYAQFKRTLGIIDSAPDAQVDDILGEYVQPAANAAKPENGDSIYGRRQQNYQYESTGGDAAGPGTDGSPGASAAADGDGTAGGVGPGNGPGGANW